MGKYLCTYISTLAITRGIVAKKKIGKYRYIRIRSRKAVGAKRQMRMGVGVVRDVYQVVIVEGTRRGCVSRAAQKWTG